MKQFVKTFFQRTAVLIFKVAYTQDFEVAVCGATRVKRLKLPELSHLEI